MILTRDETFRVVCNIRTPQSNWSYVVGTGVFIHKSDNEVYLVTASHVARSTTKDSSVAMGDSFNKCLEVPISDLSTFAWVHHPIADLASLKIQITSENTQFLAWRFLTIEHFNLSKESISRDCELTAVGFPNGLWVSNNFSPLTFRSYASSSFLTLPRADTQTLSDFFCLENPSIGWYSWGPVFDLWYMIVWAMKTMKDKTICHGFMHGTMSDDTGGKIALVTPSFYLWDII